MFPRCWVRFSAFQAAGVRVPHYITYTSAPRTTTHPSPINPSSLSSPRPRKQSLPTLPPCSLTRTWPDWVCAGRMRGLWLLGLFERWAGRQGGRLVDARVCGAGSGGAKWSGGGSIAAKSNGGYDPLKSNGAEVHGGRGVGAARGCDMAPSSVFA